VLLAVLLSRRGVFTVNAADLPALRMGWAAMKSAR
jgi:hypothetical protein